MMPWIFPCGGPTTLEVFFWFQVNDRRAEGSILRKQLFAALPYG